MTGEGERRALNRRVAKNAVDAGIPVVFVSDDKAPLWPAHQRLDQAISPAEKAEIEAEAVAKGKAPPAHVGSTRDLAIVRALFRKFPDALPAACAGVAGLIVIDVDTKRDGVNKLEAWLAEHGHAMPANTPVTVTQSGGRHYVFKDPQGLGNRAGNLATLGCDVRGRGGVFVLPGAVRSNGARYRQASADVGLLSAFAADQIPTLPDFLRSAIEAGGEKSTVVTDAETGALVARLRTAELPEPLDASRFVSTDKGGDKSAYRLSLANHMKAAGHTVEEYLATLREAEHAGVYVGDAVPDEDEYGLRNVARDWGQAEKREAMNVADAARIDAAAGEVFKLDKPKVALASIETAVAAGDYPEDECARYVDALDNAGAALATIQAAQQTCRRLMDDMTCGCNLAPALAELRGCAKVAAEAQPDASEPEHYREAKAKKAAQGSALPWEDQETSAKLMRSHRNEPLIDGIMECGAISVVYGASNIGKSFVVAGLGYAIACGASWHTHRTTKGAVVYVGLEGRSGFRRRVAALRAAMATACREPAIFATTQVDGLNLTTAESSEALRVITTVREVEAKGCLPVRLIVIDTLAAVTPGSDENSGRDMGDFVAEIKKIGAACPGVHVLIVHHSGKDIAKGARGHSKLRAAIDTELEITEGKISVTKQRDLEFAAAIGFRLEPVDLGDDDQGRPLRSAVVKLSTLGASSAQFGAVDDDGDEPTGALLRLSGDQRLIFDTAVKTIAATPGGRAAAGPIVQAVIAVAPTMRGNSVRKTLNRRLVTDGLLDRSNGLYSLPEGPKIRDS